MKKITVIFLVACLAAPTAWLLLREEPRAPISEEQAIAKIRTYIAEVEKIPEENIRIDRIESRPPTESESDFLLEWGEEPPELVWFAKITRFPSWLGPPPENSKWAGYGGMIMLNAYTGEVVLASFDD